MYRKTLNSQYESKLSVTTTSWTVVNVLAEEAAPATKVEAAAAQQDEMVIIQKAITQ